MDGLLLKISYDFLNDLDKRGLKISNIRVRIITRNSNFIGGSYLSFSNLSTFYEKYKSILSNRGYLSLYGDFLIIENFSSTNTNLNFKNSFIWYNITQSKKLDTRIQFDNKRKEVYDKEIQRYLDLMNKSIDEYTTYVNKETIIRLKLINTIAPVISGTTTLGSVLTTTNGTWNNIPTSYEYQWKRGDISVGTNSNTYTLVLADSIANITCTVKAINSKGIVLSTSNIKIANNYSPVNTVSPVISGTASLGSVLTTSNGTWDFNPVFVYQWKRNSTNIGTNVNNYTLVGDDAGQNISCEITATNPVGSGSASSTRYIPFYTVAPVISGTTTVGSLLTTTTGTWNNTPSTITYQWYRGSTILIGSTANNYTLVQADVGENITCTVTSTNPINPSSVTSPVNYIYDLDAQTFITNAAITNNTQKNAINMLVAGLKADSLWALMIAIYPFVGGSSSQHKFNLKNPLDTNEAFRLTFGGGWIHSDTGALPDGTTTYADTNFTPSTSWVTLGNSSISAYSRTNNVNAGVLWGTRSAANGNTSLYPGLRISLSQGAYVYHNSNTYQSVTPIPTTSAINLMASRTDTANLIIAVNGVASSYGNPEVYLSSFPIFLSAKNSSGTAEAGSYSNRQLAFAHIGYGLTTGQCTQLYNRIQTFQTTLGRAV